MVRRESTKWDLGNNPLHTKYPEGGALFTIVNEVPSFPLGSTFTPSKFVLRTPVSSEYENFWPGPVFLSPLYLNYQQAMGILFVLGILIDT